MMNNLWRIKVPLLFHRGIHIWQLGHKLKLYDSITVLTSLQIWKFITVTYTIIHGVLHSVTSGVSVRFFFILTKPNLQCQFSNHVIDCRIQYITDAMIHCMKNCITHWRLGNVAILLNDQLSSSCQWEISWAASRWCHKTTMMFSPI